MPVRTALPGATSMSPMPETALRHSGNCSLSISCNWSETRKLKLAGRVSRRVNTLARLEHLGMRAAVACSP